MIQKYRDPDSPLLINIILGIDISQYRKGEGESSFELLKLPSLPMVFSKSFGYALRGILYVSLMNDENRNISIDEIADRLTVPRYFLGKIMKKVVKAGILSSTRGQQGGFFINDNTLQTPLINVILLTEGKNYFNTCLLSLRACNPENPCPLHTRVEKCRGDLLNVYNNTTIGDLLKENKPEFIRSIATIDRI